MARHHIQSEKGPKQRQLRVAEIIRRSLFDVLARGDIHDEVLSGVSLTVGEVRMSPDLKVATVYVLPLGGENTPEIIEALERHKIELRRVVTKSVALKFSPELRFLADTSFDQMDETTRLLSQDQVRADVARAPEDD